jgi:argonaute-like protein implicated in RNA metabolism and viral defense
MGRRRGNKYIFLEDGIVVAREMLHVYTVSHEQAVSEKKQNLYRKSNNKIFKLLQAWFN